MTTTHQIGPHPDDQPPTRLSRIGRSGIPAVAAVAAVAAAIVLAACSGADDRSDEPGAADGSAHITDDDIVTLPGDDADAPIAGGESASPLEPAPEADATPVTVPQVASSPVDVTISGLDALLIGLPDGAPEPAVPLVEIRSGGPPPDGIPPIDAPTFLPTGAVDFLADNEPVLAIEIDDEHRAYPVQILMWHEIVNDTIAGIPVSVTYCPLCNSAVAYDRRIGELIVDFGTSGSLWNSALVMYDRQTETLWSHFNGAGIVGELTGVQLDTFPVATVPWRLWRDANPDGLVLSRDTGFTRDYGRNPYPGYDDVTSTPFLFDGEIDGTFTAMTRIVGIQRDDDALAVPLFRLRDERVVHAEIAGDRIVVFWEPGTASALDTTSIADGDDIGATGVFLTTLDGRQLTFTATGADAGFVDDESGTTWNLLGHAIDGPLAGSRLDRIEHLDTFWFAWAAFQPDSALGN